MPLIIMRRYLIIAAAAIAVLGFGAAVYVYFFAGSASLTVAPEGSAGLPIVGQDIPPVTGATSTPTTPSAPVPVSARLVRISAGPVVPGTSVVGMGAANASSSPEVAVHYIERQSGNVFSYLVRARTLTRTSNRTVPGIQSALWLPNASTAFVRYLSGTDSSTINTYALAANGSG